MSARPAPERSDRETRLAVAPTDGERSLDEAPCWPTTRLVALSLTLLLAVGLVAPPALASADTAQWAALVLPAALATLAARALFEVHSFASPRPGIRGYVAASLPPTLLALALMTLAGLVIGLRISVLAMALSAAATLFTLAAGVAARALEVRVRLGLRRVYFVGSHESHEDLSRELARRSDARLVGFAAASLAPAPLDRLTAWVLAAGATVVVLDADAIRLPSLVEVAGRLNLAGLRVRDLVSYYEQEFKKVPLGELSPAWFLFDIASIHRSPLYLPLRRALEFVLASLLLVLASPLLLALAVLVRLSGGGPALYRQERVGKDHIPFTLLKIRTMTPADDDEGAWADSHRQRVTRVGRVLRRFRLDELPQLWNVLRGDLALIGPRPEQVTIVERLDREVPYYEARHCIRPGLTGWAQVNLGYGGSHEGTLTKLQRDLYYVKHHSLRLDALILWLTLRAMLAGRG